MAKRLNPFHSEEVRRKIQASCIIDRLMKHVEGKVDMSSTQISAATALLDRSVAKLSQIQHLGDKENPITVEQIIRKVVDAKDSND